MNLRDLLSSLRKKQEIVILIFAGLLVFGVGVSPAQTKILLKDKVIVPGPAVYLGEIAVIEGGTPDYIDQIKNVRIGTAPTPVNPLSITNRLIEFRLKENQFRSGDFTLGGAASVYVYLDTVIIQGERFIAAAREYLEKNVAVENGNKVIDFFRVPQPRAAAKRDLSIKVNPTKIGRLKGTFPLYVGIYNGDKLYQSVPVQVKVRTFESMVVASRMLARGTVITENDLMIITGESTNYNNDLISDMTVLIGREAILTIAAGKPVFLQNSSPPTVIRRGDTVEIEVIRGGISITCKGVANKDGRLGDIIPVTRSNTREQLQALVVSGSKVLIK